MSAPSYVLAQAKMCFDFQERIDKLMGEGFTLHGSTFIDYDSDGSTILNQPMVRYVAMTTVTDHTAEQIKLGNADALIHAVNVQGGLGNQKHDMLDKAESLITEVMEALK